MSNEIYWIIGIISVGLIVGAIILFRRFYATQNKDEFKPDAYKSDGTLMTEEEYDEAHADDFSLDGLNVIPRLAMRIVTLAIAITVGFVVLDTMGEALKTGNVASNLTTGIESVFMSPTIMPSIITLLMILVIAFTLARVFRKSEF